MNSYFLLGVSLIVILLISGCTQQAKMPASQCLPQGIKMGDAVEIGPTTVPPPKSVNVSQVLTVMSAYCSYGKLLDGSGKEIYFYHLTGCWGNPPNDYQQILQKQQDDINTLKKQYTVIQMTCNPTGVQIS